MPELTTQRNKNPRRGFIALISTILISSMLLALAVTLGEQSIRVRESVLDAEYKNISLALADSCAHLALLKLAQKYTYSGNESGILVGTDPQGRAETCNIGTVVFPNGNAGVQNTAVITTSAEYPSQNGAQSKVVISATVQNPSYAVSANISVNSWSEMP